MRVANREADTLWAVVRDEQTTMRTMETTIGRSPIRCAEVLQVTLPPMSKERTIISVVSLMSGLLWQ
eukprot:COSAG05_NODE_29_length_29038_cov_1237.466985_25_plen_67_part_00